MRFFRLFPALLIALALFTSACGPSKEEKQIQDLSQSQKELLVVVTRELTEIQSTANALKASNDGARQQLRDADERLVIANQKIADLTDRVMKLQTALGQKTQAIEEADAKAAASKGSSVLRFVLIIVAIIVILYIIIRLMRSRSEFEDEDDDFADFEDDEDLGFEDDDLEGDKKDPGSDDDDKK